MNPQTNSSCDDGEASRRFALSRNEALLLCHLADTVPARHTSVQRRVTQAGSQRVRRFAEIARMTLCVS